MPKSFLFGNSAYGPIATLQSKSKQVTDVVRRPCSEFRHVMAPYKLYHLLFNPLESRLRQL